jgi:hypothetical protein
VQHSFIRFTLVVALLALGACSSTTSQEGAAPIGFDGLNTPADTVPGDTAHDDGLGGDATGGDTTGGDTTGGDTTGGDTTGKDTGTDLGGCGGSGVTCTADELCNPITKLCEPAGQCGAINESCDPETPEPLPFVCVEYEEGKGICRRYCVGPTAVQVDQGTFIDPCDTCTKDADCDGESTCLPTGVCGDGLTNEPVSLFDCAAPEGQASYCVPSGCESFFENTCGPDATCLPTWVNDVNACVPDGWNALDEACFVHTDCDHDLLCVDGLCSDADCAPFSDFPACGEDEQCISAKVASEELDMGWCAGACDVFYSDCPPNAWCTPELDKPEPGPVNGICIEDIGDAPEGTGCENNPGTCDEGLLCVKSGPEPAVCEWVCDPDAKPPITQGDCAGDEACVPLFLVADNGQLDEVLDFGSCADGCKPWTPQALSGCDSTWCLPTNFNPTDGQCLGDLGPIPPGDPCDDLSLESTCSAGALCLDATVGALLSGNCRVLCRAGAPPGGTGATCVGTETCDEIEYIGNNQKEFSTGIGWCNPH